MENGTRLHHGNFISKSGLSKSDIESGSFHRIPTEHFTNGFVLELCEVGQELKWPEKFLLEAIYQSCPDENVKLTLQPATLRTKLIRLKQKKKKTKKASEAYSELVNSVFPWKVAQTDPRSSSGVSQVRTNTIQAPIPQSLPCSPSTCTINKKLNQSQHLINKKTKHLKQLEKQIEKKSGHLENLGHYAKRNINKRDKRAKETLIASKANKKNLDVALEELEKERAKSIESTATLREVQKENEQLSKSYPKEQKKKRAAQKACCKIKKRLQKHQNCIPRAVHREKLREQARKIRELEIQLDILQDSRQERHLNLKDENGYKIETRMLVNELTSLEIAQSKIAPTIKAVATWLFKCEVAPLPDRKTIQQINDEGHFIAKRFIATKLEETENWGLNKDGTSRKRKKILDTTITTNSGETISLGFRQVASETGETIAEVTQEHLQELVFVSGERTGFLEKVLSTLSVYMSDRASNEKKSNRLLDEWRQDMLKDTPHKDVPEVHKFYCMAHVLLGFHKNVVKEISTVQADAGQLGRDRLPQFQHFRGDSIVERLALTTSDVFGPVGDFLGLRDLWEVHCANHGIKSRIGNYKDNRFNGLFETSAKILHHRNDFLYILTLRTSNKKLQSVQADLQDTLVVTFCQAMAILYVNITGPFWNLMDTGDIPYVNLHAVIQPLLAFLEASEEEPAILLEPAGPPCLARFRGKDSEDFNYLLVPLYPEHMQDLERVLRAAIRGIICTIRNQLKDFLEGGIYSQPASEEDLHRTKFAHKTNLSCEHHFGDLDSSQRRRPNCTMHHHSTVQMLKRNADNISIWYLKMNEEEKAALWKDARSHARELRESHRSAEKKQRDKLFTAASKKGNSSKKRRIEPETPESHEERELDRIATLKTELEAMLPEPEFKTEQWVAVAYQDDWYPGLVRKVSDCKSWIEVDFCARTTKPTHFKWPNGKDVQKVDKEFVLSTDFSLEPDRSGRVWSLDTTANDRIFSVFKEVYF